MWCKCGTVSLWCCVCVVMVWVCGWVCMCVCVCSHAVCVWCMCEYSISVVCHHSVVWSWCGGCACVSVCMCVMYEHFRQRSWERNPWGSNRTLNVTWISWGLNLILLRIQSLPGRKNIEGWAPQQEILRSAAVELVRRNRFGWNPRNGRATCIRPHTAELYGVCSGWDMVPGLLLSDISNLTSFSPSETSLGWMACPCCVLVSLAVWLVAGTAGHAQSFHQRLDLVLF